MFTLSNLFLTGQPIFPYDIQLLYAVISTIIALENYKFLKIYGFFVTIFREHAFIL